MTSAASWVVAGLVLAALEMVAPGVFLLWLGLAAIGAGLAAFSGATPHWQVVVFVLLAGGLVGSIGLRLRRRPREGGVNAPGADLVGRQCRAIGFRDGEGRVVLGDGQWSARLASGRDIPAAPVAPDTALRVVGLDGIVLLVEPE